MSQATDKKAAWKEKLGFMSPKYHEQLVGDQKIKFYPVSVGLAFKLKDCASELVRAISVFFVDKSKDVKKIDRSFTNPDTKLTDYETVIENIDVPLATYRDSKQERAWMDAVKVIMSDANKRVVGMVIIDSMREVFPRDAWTGKYEEEVSPDEFMDSLPLPMLTQLLTGVFFANKDVFGPLAETVSLAWRSVEGQIHQKVGIGQSNENADSSNKSAE